jgi:site-specific DNA recombinase
MPKHKLKGVERRISRIVAVITDDDAPVRALKTELIALEARQAVLNESLSTAATDPEPLIHPSVAELYRRQVASLHEALGDPETHDQAFELIRSLIEQIRLVPDGSALRIELRGELAGILALASESKQARGRETASLAEQIKMVAGICNHRRYEISVLV